MNANLAHHVRRIVHTFLPQILLILLLIILATSLQALIPWPFKILIDNVLGHELVDPQSLYGRLITLFDTPYSAGMTVIVGYFLVVMLSHLADYVYALYNNAIIQKITRTFARACMDHYLRLRYDYSRHQPAGKFIYQLSENVTSLSEIIENSLLPAIASLLYLGMTTYILGRIDIKMALISLLSIPILSLTMAYTNNQIDHASTALERKRGLLLTYVEQIVSQLRIIQIYNQEHKTNRTHSNTLWRTLQAELRMYQSHLISTLVNGLVICLTYTSIIGVGIAQVSSGQLSTGLLIVFIFYLDSLISPITSVIEAVAVYKENYAKLTNLNDIFDPTHQIKDNGSIREIYLPDITLRSVSVYAHEHPILSDVTTVIPHGTFCAVIGKSGAGKSTFFNLIMRTIDATKGEVYIDSHKIHDIRLDTLRQNLAYVPQEAVVFDDTIENIIRFGDEGLPMQSVERAARLACAHDFISRKPLGYKTRVGHSGNLLSGGERQRLLLARAYLKDPSILLLDELFSGQDHATQVKLITNLRAWAKNKTVLLITHVYDVLLPSDHTLIFDNGKIVYSGTYKQAVVSRKLPHLNQKGGDLHAKSRTQN